MKDLKKLKIREVSKASRSNIYGGGESTNKAKMADKAFNAMTQYISS